MSERAYKSISVGRGRIRQSASWYRLSGVKSQNISRSAARECLGKSVVDVRLWYF